MRWASSAGRKARQTATAEAVLEFVLAKRLADQRVDHRVEATPSAACDHRMHARAGQCNPDDRTGPGRPLIEWERP
jgi:hypothetical protein